MANDHHEHHSHITTAFRQDLSLGPRALPQKLRLSRASCGLDTGASASKQHSGSVQLQSVCGSKPEGSNRLSHKCVGGSEIVEDILPKGDHIVVRSDLDVAYERRNQFSYGGDFLGSVTLSSG